MKWFLSPTPYPRPAHEQRLLATAREHLTLSECAFAIWGQPGRPRILLLHGWSGRGTQMGAFVEPLVAAGFEVWTMDAPGHGDSQPGSTNLGRFMKAVLAVTQERGPFHGFVGHSLGGTAGFAAMARGAPIGRIVMIGSPSDISIVFSHFTGFVGLSAKACEVFNSMVESEVGHTRRELSPVNLAETFNKPCMVLHDPADPQVSIRHVDFLVEKFKGLKVVRIEKVGHYRILKSPLTIRAVVDFFI